MSEYDPIESAETSPEDEKELRLWATLLHLSLLAGLIIPFGGLVVPVVIYLVKKDDVPGLQPHWHVVVNWLLSAIIYAVICFILMLVLIGFVLIWALGLLSLISRSSAQSRPMMARFGNIRFQSAFSAANNVASDLPSLGQSI